MRKGPYELVLYDDDEEARCSWQIRKNLGLSADNDKDMIDALAADHMKKGQNALMLEARKEDNKRANPDRYACLSLLCSF